MNTAVIHQHDNVVDLTKHLPEEVDTINYWAVNLCETMLDAPSEEDIQWVETSMKNLLKKMHKGL